ncbi:MAG: phosphatidylserine decarboxylase [Alphaproteobacteria bacterium]|nr:phosphatidylserine decarboxylase [Alphaproteobacteria bacterium]
MNDALIVKVLSAVPKNPTARFMGRTARLRLPRFLHRALVGWFVRKYRVDLSECQGGVEDFDSLAHFFVRPLKPGMRPVDPRPDVLVSPVDAKVHTFGTIQGGRFLQADGVDASVAELIGVGDPRAPGASSLSAERFEGGAYAVLYLSPRDYHRVHTAREGRVTEVRYLPGTLWPVFAAATREVPGLFGKNERLAFTFDTDLGAVVEVMVGAFGVGRMTTVIGDVVTNDPAHGNDVVLEHPVALDRAAELGRFELGSTVILLFEPGRVEWQVEPGQPVQLGQPIARVFPG